MNRVQRESFFKAMTSLLLLYLFTTQSFNITCIDVDPDPTQRHDPGMISNPAY